MRTQEKSAQDMAGMVHLDSECLDRKCAGRLREDYESGHTYGRWCGMHEGECPTDPGRLYRPCSSPNH